MKGIQNQKGQDLQKPFPGCMGRMINIFDSSASTSGTKLITEKAHRDGPPVGRNQSEGAKTATDPVAVRQEDKQEKGKLGRNMPDQRSGGTPIKMLIEEEMEKGGGSGPKPTNLVARLMGLNGLPGQQSVGKEYLCDGFARQDKYYEQRRQINYLHGSKERKDVCRVFQNPPRIEGCKYDHLGEKLSYENRMALVRQKLAEANCLATDEKLLRSKEFQDAVHFLSSNRGHLQELQSVTAPSETKQITLLKPSETIKTRGNGLMAKQLYPLGDEVEGHKNKHCRSPSFIPTATSASSQPTRIVLLKPVPGKVCGTKTMATPVSSTDREASLSSIDVDGYMGDDSSVNNSESESVEDESGEASDWEIAIPTSHHSWDCTSRIGGPYSVSPLSRTHRSCESSVSREAKKRLCERWAMVSSTAHSKDRGQRTMSTLGDVLAIHEEKKAQMDGGQISLRSRVHEKDEKEEVAQLTRSKSVPISSSACEGIENSGSSDSFIYPGVREETVKLKSGKSSFREKVSSFFFLKNKKFLREISSPSASPVLNDRCENGICDVLRKVNDDLSLCAVDSQPKDNEEVSSTGPERNLGNDPSAASCYDIQNEGTISSKDVSSTERLEASGICGETQDQPSPVSVLEAPFICELNNSLSHQSDSIVAVSPKALCRSPPIASAIRSPSWDDFQLEATSPNSSRLSRLFSKADEEQSWLQFIQKLLSSAGLDTESLSGTSTPLSPRLLNKVSDQQVDRADFKERQAEERLLFDSVNEALLDIGRSTVLTTYPWADSNCRWNVKGNHADFGSPLAQQVWQVVRSWSSSERYFLTGIAATDKSRGVDLEVKCGVDLVVKGEVAGRTWIEMMWFEMYELDNELCGLLLEELVEEALLGVT